MSTFDSQDIDPSESSSQFNNGFEVSESSSSANFLSSGSNTSTALSSHSTLRRSTSSAVDPDDYLFIKKDDIVLARAARILGVHNCYFKRFWQCRIRHLLGLACLEKNLRDRGHILTKLLISKPTRLKRSASIVPRVTHILVPIWMAAGRQLWASILKNTQKNRKSQLKEA